MRRLVAATLVTLLFAGACAPSSAGDDHNLTAWFERGVSLYEGGDVRVLGLPAGDITDVDVVGTRVRVRMSINDDVSLPENVQATIVPLSLIGERYVQLFPVWKEGDPELRRGATIPIERTSIPVEPDEALAALKEFLDTLDPDATGRLIKNLGDDLDGNGQALNDAIGGITDLTNTLEKNDDQLLRIAEHFDDFSATLLTRERQLGRVMDQFAVTARTLSEERGDIERLVKGLANVSVDGLDLVSEHRTALDRDVKVLTRTLMSVEANIDGVRALLSAMPIMVAGEDLDGKNEGLNAAYDPTYHRIDLRNATSPLLSDLFRTIGLPSLPVCVPVGVTCPPGTTVLPALPGAPIPAAASANATAPTPAPRTGLGPVTPDIRGSEHPVREEGDGGALAWVRSVGRSLAEVLS